MNRIWIGLLSLTCLISCKTAENTATPPGDLAAFDPIANFAAMAAYAGPEARLVSMRASYVQTNGMMDLNAEYHPMLTATFVTKATQADVDAQGPKAPGSGFTVGALLETGLTVRAPYTAHVTSGGSEWDEKHLGMERSPGSTTSSDRTTVDPPKCSFAQLWKDAISKGAPTDVVANITYGEHGYEFEANGRNFRLTFDASCKLSAPTTQP